MVGKRSHAWQESSGHLGLCVLGYRGTKQEGWDYWRQLLSGQSAAQSPAPEQPGLGLQLSFSLCLAAIPSPFSQGLIHNLLQSVGIPS